MNKLIALVLSFSLVFGSVTPSLAQQNKIVQGAKAIKQAGAGAQNLVPNTIKKIPGVSVGTNLRYVPNAPAIKPLAPYAPGVHFVAPASSDESTQKLNENLTQAISKQALQASAVQAKKLDDIKKLLAKSNFSEKDAKEIYDQIFKVERTNTATEFLLLNTLPIVTVERGFALGKTQADQALSFYRNLLLSTINAPVNLPETASLNDLFAYSAKNAGSFDVNNWSKSMAAATNLGFFGSAKDASLLLDTYIKTPAILKPITEVVIGRALLNLQAYEALERLAVLSAGKNGKLSGQFWEGLQTYVRQQGLPVKLAEVENANPLPITKRVDRLLSAWNELNIRHLDGSVQATARWVALGQKKGKIVAEVTPRQTQAAPEKEAPLKPVAVPEIAVDLSNVEAMANLSVGPHAVPVSENEARAVETAENTSLQSQQSQVAEKEVAASPAKTTKLFNWVKKIFNPAPVEEKGATDQDAKLILSKVFPLNSQLRRILEGPTSNSYKEQALLQLYQRGSFAKAIANFPAETQAALKTYNTTELKKALFSFYQHRWFDKDISQLTDVTAQELLTDEVRLMTLQKNWEEMARAAYADAPSLPLGGENFVGVVPTVPEADQKNISEAFRLDPNFAFDNCSAGVDRGNTIYYENHIPFYYRDSQGHLSSKPVGILTQEKPSLYGRLLSKIGLASKPGLSIPKGFVLALDEQGQWKYVMPVGNLPIVESIAASRKILKDIRKKGSTRVEVDVPYTTTDMLALGKMLANNPNLNLELTLNTPHSLKQYLNLHAFFVGNDAGASLAGPFKETLKGVEGWAGLLGNLTSGVGYLTPWIGGAAMKKMTKWGNAISTQMIYGLAGGGLLYSLFGLGMNGTVDPSTLNLWELAIPTVALVLGASLANSFIQTFLNFYKDPKARTSAHLNFSGNKQWSRLLLTLGTAVAAGFCGLNWTIVVPVGLGLVAVSELLFLNTPVFKDAKRFARNLKLQKKGELPPSEKKFMEKAEAAAPTKFTPEEEAKYKKSYKELVSKLQDVKDIKTRVKLVYASYAASLLVLNQAATAVLGSGWGQALVGLFMFATAMTRRYASKWVSSNKMTDDQLTGISLPLLAISGGLLAAVPVVGWPGLIAGALGIIHYMATAVPGQLDTARWQNIVTKVSQELKMKVNTDPNLTAEEKTAKIKELDRQEKYWGSRAAAQYSYANGHGLIGIGAVAGMAFLFSDVAPAWATDMLASISHFFGNEPISVSMSRLVFAYAAAVAGVLSYKNWSLTKDFLQKIGKGTKITDDAIKAGKIHASSFGITPKNVGRRMAELNDTMTKKLDNQLVNYGVNSEQKMTQVLQSLINMYNRFVAAKELEPEKAAYYLDAFGERVRKYDVLLQKNKAHLSVKLSREFDKLKMSLFEKEDMSSVREDLPYIEEGFYSMPEDYAIYEEARSLLDELDSLANLISKGGTVGMNSYDTFISYQNRVKKLLQQYSEKNPEESTKVLEANTRLNNICSSLRELDKKYNVIEKNAGPSDAGAILRLRDVLDGYAQ